MKIIQNTKKENWSRSLQRPTKSDEDIAKTVNQILSKVTKHREFAVNKYKSNIDGIEFPDFVLSDDALKETVQQYT